MHNPFAPAPYFNVGSKEIMGIDVRIITESEQELGLLPDPENLTVKRLPEFSDDRLHGL